MIGPAEARQAEALRSRALCRAGIQERRPSGAPRLTDEETLAGLLRALDALGIKMRAIMTGLSRLARQRGLGEGDQGRLVDFTDGYLHGFVDGALAGRIEARNAADAGTGEGNEDGATNDPGPGGSRG